MTHPFYIHLVSDATGSTLQGLARACVAQFEGLEPIERLWPLVRTPRQLDRVIADIADYPGLVIFTLVNPAQRARLQGACRKLGIPCLPVLDPLMDALSQFTGMVPRGVPGLQHRPRLHNNLRQAAIEFAMTYDNRADDAGLDCADVILVGLPRTMKTPVSVALARDGIKAANMVYVPEMKIERCSQTPVMALARSSGNSAMTGQDDSEAMRLYATRGWPVIEVGDKSDDDIADEIRLLLQIRRLQDTATA